MDSITIINKYKGVLGVYRKGGAVRVSHEQKQELHFAFQEIYKRTVNIYCDSCVFEMLNLLGNWVNNNLNTLQDVQGQENGTTQAGAEQQATLPDGNGLPSETSSRRINKNKRRK